MTSKMYIHLFLPKIGRGACVLRLVKRRCRPKHRNIQVPGRIKKQKASINNLS